MSSIPRSTPSAPSPALRVISYWRDSLADGARQDLARTVLAPVVADPGGRFAVPRDVLRDGVVPETGPHRIREIFRAAAKSARQEDAGDDAPSCRVLVCPLVARGEVRHGARAASDDFVVPLWIPALLFRDGRLAPPPDAGPWIPRDRLEPGGRETRPVVLGSVDAVDRFLSVTEPPDPAAGWTAYWKHAWAMLEAVGRDAGWTLTPDGFDLGALRLARPGAYVTLPAGFVVPQAPPAAMVAPLMATYEHVLGAGTVPVLLERFAAVDPREQAPPLDADVRLRAHALHLGQMSDVHALAPSQREALHHALRLDDGDLLAINGPPGTGKTTLLQSVVASLWVRAAVDGGEPPVIVATSANNQAVTNVIESFGKAVQAEGPLSGRWLPEVRSFGLFCAAKDRQDEAAKTYQVASFQGGPFPDAVQTPEYVERARTEFLGHAAQAFGTAFDSLTDAIARLHGELTRVAGALEDGVRRRQALLHARADAESRFRTLHLAPLVESAAREVGDVEREMADARARFDAEGARLWAERNAAAALAQRRAEADRAPWLALRERWQAFDAATPWWMVALGWLPPVRAHRLALIRRFLSSSGEAVPPELRGPGEVDGWIAGALERIGAASAESVRAADGAFAQGMRAAETEEGAVRIPAELRLIGLRDRLRALRNAEARLNATAEAWIEWVGTLRDEAARLNVPRPSPEDALNAADRLLRARAFQLATHYWEGRWLEEMRQAIESGGIQRLERRARDPQEVRWRRYAKLTPCIVSTLFKLPSFFTWWGGEKTGNVPLLSYIDLLIVDEAGQVSPELAGAAFALARRALVVGDVEQLQPVWSVSAWGDAGNLRIAGLADGPREYERIAETGITAAGGSAMRVAQRQSPYRIPGLPYGGMLLAEHYRCAPPIIAYCNELCYGGRLVPIRPGDEQPPELPRMGYAHVRGTARRTGGSRDNPAEAQAIARWIVDHADALRELGARARGLPEDAPRPPLAQVLAVVTPFRAQAGLIRRALGRVGDGLVINTVHALQGDERDVILFSPVYTQDERGSRPMLEDRALLNVAVSRARESFLVFGDMGVFDVRAGTASGLLGRHLMARQENEITDVVVPAMDGLDPVRELSGLEPHRAALREFFTSAEHVVRITSPWISAHAIRDDGIDALVRGAVARGVQVVCYVDADLNRREGHDRPAAAEGKRLLVESGAIVRIARRIHNKTVTVDDRVISEGSFNWLSAVRRPESLYHRLERTLVYEDGAAPLIRRFLADIEPRVVEAIQPAPRGSEQG